MLAKWAARVVLLVLALAALYGLFVPTIHWGGGPIWPWTTKDLSIGFAVLTILAYVAVAYVAVWAVVVLVEKADL